MKTVNKFFLFYIKSSIHVALAVFSLSLINSDILHIHLPKWFFYLVFFATIFAYNFIKYYLLPKKYFTWTTNFNKALLFLNFFALAASLFYLSRLSIPSLFWIVFLTILNILYSIPIGKRNLRSYGLLKPFLVVFVWVGFSLGLGIIESGKAINSNIIILSIQQAALVLALLLLFEIRDLEKDPEYLRTIPMRLPLTKTKILIYGLSILWFGLFWAHPNLPIPKSSYFIFVCLLMVIWYAEPKRQFIFTAFWVEAIPIAWLLLYCVLDKSS
ncbi:MAG: hypothetical protein OIF50_16075 [Flavobacteriaceae bacterium]|nr:hypothetical protein [Flavobacteriaceae bacterium]